MSLSIGELVGYVDLDTSGVTRGAAKTRATMADLGNDMEATATRSGTGFSRLAGTALKGLAIGLTGAGVAGGVMGIKTAAGMEQARISFTTMLGSAEKADAFLGKLADFAASTPFEFPELQTASSSLIAAGIDASKVIPIMTTLGDVTAGMGTGSEGIKRATIALQQMQAAGKITGEDLNQLRDAGVPVYDLLAKATGKSKAEVVALAQAGKLGSKELGQMMKALETGKGLERFSGLMEKQSHSLTGMWSTFTDTLNMQLAKAVTPMIPMLKDGLGGAAEFVAAAVPKVASALQLVLRVGTAVIGFLTEHKTTAVALGVTVGALTAVIMAYDAAMAVAAAGGMLKWLQATKLVSSVTKAYTAVQWALNAAMSANPLVLVGMLLAALAVGLVVAYKKSETFRNIVNGAFSGVAAVAGKVLSWLTKAVGATLDWIKGHWKLLVAILAGPLGVVVYLVAKHWDKVQAATSAVWGAVKRITASVWGAIRTVVTTYVRTVLAVIMGLAAVPGKVAGFFGRAKDGAVNALGELLSWVRGLPGRVLGAIGNVSHLLWNAGSSIIGGLIDGIESKVSSLRDKLQGVTKMIPDWKGPAATDRKLLVRNGQLIMDGLLDGIDSGVVKLHRLLSKVTKGLSDGKVGAVDKAVAATYARGIRLADNLDAVAKRLTKARARLSEAVKVRADFLASVRDAALGFGSVTAAGGDGPVTGAGVVAAMQAKLDAVKQFRANMATLLADGLDRASYKQMLEQGVEQSGALAQALVDDPASVAAVANLSKQMQKAATGLGKDSSSALYDAGVAGSRSLVKGLLRDRARLRTAAQRIAQTLAREVAKALGIALSQMPGHGGKGGTGGSANRVPTYGKGPNRGHGRGPDDGRPPVVRERIIDRRGPLIGTVNQSHGESADTLAERLWFKTRKRG